MDNSTFIMAKNSWGGTLNDHHLENKLWYIPRLEYYTTMKMNELLYTIISGNLTSLKYKLERRKKTPKDCILDDMLFIKFVTETI